LWIREVIIGHEEARGRERLGRVGERLRGEGRRAEGHGLEGLGYVKSRRGRVGDRGST